MKVESIGIFPRNRSIYQRDDVKECCSSKPLRYQGYSEEGYKIALWCTECGECSEATTGNIEKYCAAVDGAVLHWNNRVNS